MVVIESSIVGALLLFSLLWCCCCSPSCTRYGLTTIFTIIFLGISLPYNNMLIILYLEIWKIYKFTNSKLKPIAWIGILLYIGLGREDEDDWQFDWIFLGSILGIAGFVLIVFIITACCCTR